MTSAVHERIFYSAERGAQECGYSLRQFRRVTEDNDIEPLEFGRLFIWMHDQIEAIKVIHRDRIRKKRKSPDAYKRSFKVENAVK